MKVTIKCFFDDKWIMLKKATSCQKDNCTTVFIASITDFTRYYKTDKEQREKENVWW